jgi:hypothetical protein
MRQRMRRASADETGAVMLIALGFIAIIGFVGLALINFAATNLRATAELRPVRSVKYGADAAVESAINKFRQDFTVPCGTATGVTPNFYKLKVDESLHLDPAMQDIVVDCGPQVVTGSSRRLTFTARCLGTPYCPAGRIVLVAKVRFDGTPPAVTTIVETWSVHQ